MFNKQKKAIDEYVINAISIIDTNIGINKRTSGHSEFTFYYTDTEYKSAVSRVLIGYYRMKGYHVEKITSRTRVFPFIYSNRPGLYIAI